jgi:hypothetical protein
MGTLKFLSSALAKYDWQGAHLLCEIKHLIAFIERRP